MAAENTRKNSVETILTSNENEDSASDTWSVVWSTTYVPGMDTATGGGRQRRQTGRRRLRFAALSLGGLLCMHCRVTASALTCGIFIFLLLLLPAVMVLANPTRHFETYLGEWSISGPGRAFRLIPCLDGLGLAICVHALFRAMTSIGIAAVAGVYILSTIRDEQLPLYWCRDFNLRYYNPDVMYVNVNLTRFDSSEALSEQQIQETTGIGTLGPQDLSWQEALLLNSEHIVLRSQNQSLHLRRVILVCKETYSGGYPPLYRTTAYNYFYVEAMHYRDERVMTHINVKHLAVMMVLYAVIWVMMILEKIIHGRIIWNNISKWICFVPWLWACLIVFMGCYSLFTRHKGLRNVLKIGESKDVIASIMDSFEVAIYIHASAIGTEMILGKGLNYYASGHIDPSLHGEIMWHSSLLMILTAIITGGAATCAMTDYMQMKGVNRAHDSALWVFPMYAKCAAGVTQYTHITSILIFSGLCFSYTAVAFVCIKSALHTIFEYRVKLVFIEQLIVFAVIFFCAGISVLFSADGGLALLEAFDGVLTGIVAPLICFLELIAMIFVYRSHDFVSDMNVATEDNACSTRIEWQWRIAPFLCIALVVTKCVEIWQTEIPLTFVLGACSSVLLVILVIPLRTAYNAYRYMHRPTRRLTKT